MKAGRAHAPIVVPKGSGRAAAGGWEGYVSSWISELRVNPEWNAVFVDFHHAFAMGTQLEGLVRPAGAIVAFSPTTEEEHSCQSFAAGSSSWALVLWE